VPDDRNLPDAVRGNDVSLAAVLLAIDPIGLGGASLRGRAGGAREAWLGLLRRFLPDGTLSLRVPPHITDDRLLGGLDLGATLAAGRPIVERGVLANADGGLLLLPLAERLSQALAARISTVMDTGEVAVERDGMQARLPVRFGVVTLDEGLADDEHPPEALLDRLAFHLSLENIDAGEIGTALDTGDIVKARRKVTSVAVKDNAIEALCAVAAALGIGSLNAPLLALKTARAHAAVDGRRVVGKEDIAAAARLVLAPRAKVVPLMEDEEPQAAPDPEPNESEAHQAKPSDASLQDIVLAAAQAAIPPGLLASLAARKAPPARHSAPGRTGHHQDAPRRGRPAGVRRGNIHSSARLNVVETLRAASPWQRLRTGASSTGATDENRRIEVRSDDFRIKRLKERRETVTLFVVDASGSSALNRLAEAKGAVEILLADCYVRRDQVALIAFGGRGAELLLPPTRSLTRAKRRLADLPGGGGTPLADALEQAGLLAQAIKRRQQTPAIVVLTDGRPNLARNGRQGREPAEQDALAAARVLRDSGIAALLIDTSPRAEPCAARIAEAMGAPYVPLPHMDARTLSDEVKARIGS